MGSPMKEPMKREEIVTLVLATFLTVLVLGIYVVILFKQPYNIITQCLLFSGGFTIVFTGVLHATGKFETAGKVLGGAAAIFFVLLPAVAGIYTTLGNHQETFTRVLDLAKMVGPPVQESGKALERIGAALAQYQRLTATQNLVVSLRQDGRFLGPDACQVWLEIPGPHKPPPVTLTERGYEVSLEKLNNPETTLHVQPPAGNKLLAELNVSYDHTTPRLCLMLP